MRSPSVKSSLFVTLSLSILGSVLLPLLGGASCTPGMPQSPAGDSSPAAQPSTPADTMPDPVGSGQGSLTVHLVDGPIDAFKEVAVEVQKVLVIDEKGMPQEIAAPGKVIDLLKLQGDLRETLADVKLAAGRYQGLRLVLGDQNSVRMADDSVQQMKTPSAQQSGLKLDLAFEIKAGEGSEIFLDFDLAESVRLVTAGPNKKILLHPMLHAVLKQRSGSIEGRLTLAGAETPIAGAEVFAERLDAQGQPTIVRRVRSDAEGRYVLDLLPLGASYVVVSQPALGNMFLAGSISNEIALLETAPTATFDAALTVAAAVGSVRAVISPMAPEGQSDTCQLLTMLNDRPIIVASEGTVQDADEQLQLDGIPTGSYAMQCLRRSTDESGSPVVTAAKRIQVTIEADTAKAVQVEF